MGATATAETRRRRFGAGLVAYVGAPLGLLLLLEGAVRIVPFGSVPRRELPAALVVVGADGFYANRPGFSGEAYGHTVTTDRDGLRRDPDARPASGAPRVLLLGDSVVFGLGAPDPFAPGAALARVFRDTIRVLNAGVIGYATGQQARWLTARGGALAPDAVVVVYCLNDPLPTPHPADALQREADLPPVRWAVARIERHSALAFHTVRLGRRFAAATGLTASPADALVALHDGPAWAAVEAGLTQIRDWGAARGVPVGIVVVPLAAQVADTAVSGRPQARLDSLGRALGLPVVDLRPAMRPYHYLRHDETHLNGAGAHAAMRGAAALVRRLLLAASLPPRPHPRVAQAPRVSTSSL